MNNIHCLDKMHGLVGRASVLPLPVQLCNTFNAFTHTSALQLCEKKVTFALYFDFSTSFKASRGNRSVSALPPPRPKSPPEYPDLYGKRRELAKIQMLEREIGFLEEELKSVDGFQQASRSCKEVAEFITSNADPLMPTSRTKEIRRPRGFGKWLCGVSCFNVSGICTTDPEIPPCSKCPCSGLCVSCRVPEFACGSCSNTRCLNKSKCCCIPKFPSCMTCSCSSIKCTYPKCVEVNFCSCYKNCCYPSYFCY